MHHRRLPIVRLRAHSRRDVLRYIGGVTVAATVPLPTLGCSTTPAPASTGFFTDDERTALGALANAVIPPDDKPGGQALGAVEYIEGLMTAFDNESATVAPTIFAGGPFSGRNPWPDENGQPSTDFPPNEFQNFLQLDRVKEAGWRLMLFGSSGVPGGGPNDAILGPVIGLREQMKTGLAAAIAGATAPLDQLDQSDLQDYFNSLETVFRALVIELVTEGCFGPPEYGGNANLAGWDICHFEGDSQPLGYSVWSTALGQYVERPDAPMSTLGGPDPEPLDPQVTALLDSVVQLLGGMVFQS
jgi:hypothetical protein